MGSDAQAGIAPLPDLTELSIEELANIEVISASRTPLRQSQSAAAVFVVTGEDIRRSGVTSLAEALRMVPGIQAARISSSKWSVSARGFNSRYSNKLLVLMDGRTLYLPLFSGVFWESQDYMLEDIERIEVIRGPGASLWGANAVNGVINIITRSAEDTTGTLLTAGAGDYEKGFARARFGAALGDRGHARFYASGFARDEMADANGRDLEDPWKKYQAGFRTDTALNDRSDLTVQGDCYRGDLDELSSIPSLSPPYTYTVDAENEISGFNLLSRLTHRFSGGGDVGIQLYFDTTRKEEGGVDMADDIVDVEAQFRLPPVGRHDLVWGLGYRHYEDDIDFQSMGIAFSTQRHKDSLYSAFVQDTVTVHEGLQMILGSRFEHNEYSGFEIQPNARVLWQAAESHVLWAALSRAVRTPSRGDTDIRYTQAVIPPSLPDQPLPSAVTVWGLDSVDSENLTAFELGHRITSFDRFSLDSTVFYYRYTDLTTNAAGDPIPRLGDTPPHVIQPLYVGNDMDASTVGFEVTANIQPLDFLRVQASYAFIDLDFDITKDAGTIYSTYSSDETPRHQASVRILTDLPWDLECDIWLRCVDEIKNGLIDGYTEMDLRLGWNPSRHLELSLCGRNLLHKSHAEYVETYVLNSPAEVPRSVYGKVTVRF
ncbi:TonB-dependent receptor plug domain-containing protein [Desulfatiferula olefinivorans]